MRLRAQQIAEALGGARRYGRGWLACCPGHDDHNPSLALADGEDGRLLVKCFAGCSFRDVFVKLREHRSLDLSLGAQSPARLRSHEDRRGDAGERRRAERALALWCEARPAVGTIVERYLRSRGIIIGPPPCLRCHPQCRHPSGVRLPAMLALIEREGRGPVAVHRTFLWMDGARKAAVDPDKASLGPVRSGAVRFAAPKAGEWLVLAEGVETALSIMQATCLPAWATLGTAGLTGIILPQDVCRVMIAADNDGSGAGERAAHTVAERLLAEGRRVKIAMPPEPECDFNDMLLQGRDVTA